MHRVISRRPIVGFKRAWMLGGPSRTGGKRRISEVIRNERTTPQTGPFQVNPEGRGAWADFLCCSLLTYGSRYGRLTASPALSLVKIGPIADGDMLPTYDTTHYDSLGAACGAFQAWSNIKSIGFQGDLAYSEGDARSPETHRKKKWHEFGACSSPESACYS